MSADLEQLVRRTLQGRAAAVSTGPEWQPPVRNRRPRWIAAVAAAAAVAAIAVAAVLLPSGQHDRSRPQQSGTTTHTAAPVVPPTCRTTLPEDWQQAFVGGQLALGGIGAIPTSVAPDGTVVIARDGGLTPGSPRDVLLLRAGKAAQSVYQVPDPDHLAVQSADLVGDTLVVALRATDRPARGTEPGSSPMPNVQRLLAIDLTTGHQHLIASMPGGVTQRPYLDGSIVVGGRVYWDERPGYAEASGVIKSYGLQSGDVRTEYSGHVDQYPIFSAGGIGATNEVYVRATLPAPVAHGLDPKHPLLLASDGSSYAWQLGTHEIGWWAPGQSAPTYLRIPETLPDNYPGGLVVSGQFVIADGRTLVDMQTRAQAQLAGGNLPTGKFFEPAIAAGGGLLAGANYVGEGHFQDGYWEDPQPRVIRLDTADLPELHC